MIYYLQIRGSEEAIPVRVKGTTCQGSEPIHFTLHRRITHGHEVLQGQGRYSAHVKVIMATVLEVYRYTHTELHAAGHMRISDVICIVTHTSPLKTNDVAAEKKSPCQSFRVIKLPSTFMYRQ